MRWIRVPVALVLSLSLPGVAMAVPPPPSAPAPQPQPDPQPQPQPVDENLSEEEKIEKAKGLYMEAEGLAKEGNFVDAVPLYEQAYYLVPGKHGFAHKVGVTAYKAGDCDKANTYLKHFIEYGDPEKHGAKIDEAKQILGEISVSGCATEASSGGGGSSTSKKPVDDNENPLGDSTRDSRQQEAAKARKDKKDEKRGLLIGGAVLTSVGVAGLGLGAVSLGIASSSANSLRDLSSNNTVTGFPTGDYACRDVPADQCPFKLESRLKTMNAMSYVGFGVGGVALAAGVAMLAIYMVNKKKRGGATEATPTEGEAGVELSGLGPMFLPGPGGGAGAMAEIRF